MMNSNQTTEPELPADAPDPSSSPPQPPPEDDRKARDRWRRIGLRLGHVAEAEVVKLRDNQKAEKNADINPTIRAIAQVVLTSLRAMEMEDSYDRKLGNEGEDDANRKRRREALRRMRNIGREVAGSSQAGRESADAEKKELDE